MKSNQKLTLLFWLRKGKATKDGKAPLYVRVTIDGSDEDISLGQKVHPDDWDIALKRAKGKNLEDKKVNQAISGAEVDLERLFQLLQIQYESVSPLILKNAFLKIPLTTLKKNNFASPDIPQCFSLLQAVDDFILKFEKKTEKAIRSKETLRQWRSTRNKIAGYLSYKFKIDDIPLKDIKYSFAEGFYEYLTVDVDYPLAEVTANKHIKKTKQILQGCTSREWMDKNPIQQYKCGGDNKEVMPLEFSDVMKLYKKKISCKRLSEVRDAFIFQCFTGFAYQDVYALNPSHLINVGSKGERWLIKDRGKTGVSEMVPLLPVTEEIIARYKTHPYCRVKGCLLPVNSNARYNGYLKELAVICNLDRSLNTHLARHTFADMMLNNGVPLEDVARMLGHKNIRTTQRYTTVRKQRISSSMKTIKSILFDKEGNFRKPAEDDKN